MKCWKRVKGVEFLQKLKCHLFCFLTQSWLSGWSRAHKVILFAIFAIIKAIFAFIGCLYCSLSLLFSPLEPFHPLLLFFIFSPLSTSPSFTFKWSFYLIPFPRSLWQIGLCVCVIRSFLSLINLSLSLFFPLSFCFPGKTNIIWGKLKTFPPLPPAWLICGS